MCRTATVVLTLGVLWCASVCFASGKVLRADVSDVALDNISLLNETRHSLELGYEYLLGSQMPDGSWKQEPAITGLVLYSFMLSPQYNPDGKTEGPVQKGMEYLKQFVKPDGGIYREGNVSYTTAVCLLAFAESDGAEYEDIVRNAKDFLIEFQVDEGEGYSKEHRFYGGIGYGGDDRPDLSNTQFALDAIKAAEEYETRFSKIIPSQMGQLEEEESELGLHWQKALVFLARCQNVKAVNDMDYATDDGGFIYETGHYDKGRDHSYGSMTYAGMKSLLYAKLSKDDIRVKRAVSWIKDHYTLEENPGFGTSALFYYYMTFAKCLEALGEETIVDSEGADHIWRDEYLKKLISIQKEEGMWENTSGRYWENIKDLTTAYATIGMKFALKGMLQ